MTDNVHHLPPGPQPPVQRGHGSNNGGNGGTTLYRLSELERRVGVLEDKVDNLTNICIEINTKLSGMATKHYVVWTCVIVLGTAISTLIAHVILRQIGG
ncbi:MAG: hypothetical protein OXH64_07230 [Rhodospirillaceae bacterium]|nr:hypothetical protein [Rhodospirillaceae bacterium]